MSGGHPPGVGAQRRRQEARHGGRDRGQRPEHRGKGGKPGGVGVHPSRGEAHNLLMPLQTNKQTNKKTNKINNN